MKWYHALAIFLVIHAVLFCYIAWRNPEYLYNYRMALNPDAVTYVDLGRNIWMHGAYSRSVAEPFQPDFKWTPMYPVLVGLVEVYGGTWAIFLLNILLSGITCVLLYRLLAHFFTPTVGAVGAFLFAIDPLGWSLNFQAMSDTTFLFFLVLGMYFYLPTIFPDEELTLKSPSVFRLFLAGLSFGFAILTRPTGLYLPAILLVCYGTMALWRRNNWWQTLRTAGIFFVCSYMFVALWMVRNYHTFGFFTLSGNENIVLVYYTGGGAWQIENDCTLREAQELIRAEYDLPSVGVCHNASAFNASPVAIHKKLSAKKRDVLLKYPLALARSAAIGLPKSFVAHETGNFATLTNSPWHGVRGGSESLARNPFWLNALCAWSVLFQCTLGILAFVGVVTLWKCYPKYRWLAFSVAGCGAYFILTLGLSGADCCARYRFPMMPILYALEALAICIVMSRLGHLKHFSPICR